MPSKELRPNFVSKRNNNLWKRTQREEKLNGYINLPYVRNTSEILVKYKNHQISCTFYMSETLRKLISHPKDRVPTEKRNNVVYQINCQDHQRAVTNCDTEKNEIAKHCWENDHVMDWQNKKVIDQEQNMVARKIKETIHSIGNENSINNISYNLPHIWLPALKKNRNVAGLFI